jgi:transposase
MGIRLMKSAARGRQRGSRNYTKEFRESVAAEANDPNRSIAEVARTYGLNANMVAQWRRSLLEAQRVTLAPGVELLPVDVIDLPTEDILNHAPMQTEDVPAALAMSPSCEIEIELGKRRIRITGVSQEFAERFLQDCLK